MAVLDRHVVFLTNYVPPYRLALFRELAKRVRRLTVLVSTKMEKNRKWGVDWSGLEVRLQKTVTLGGVWRHSAGFRDGVEVHFPYDTLGQLSALRPDAVVSLELGFRSAMAALYRTWDRRTRLLIFATMSEHTERGRGRLRGVVRRWLVRRLDRVIVHGASGVRYFQGLGVPRGRIAVMPNPSVAELFARVPLGRDAAAAQRLLYVGQLTERKGVVALFEALGRWAAARPGVPVALDVVGSGPLRQRLEAMPRPGNLTVRLLGEMPFAQLPARYGEAGIFVFPTLADPWGLVVNEAMASGLPVLGSLNAQAVEELVSDGVNGWAYRPEGAGLDEALARALATPAEKLERMRGAARDAVAHLTPGYAADLLVAAVRDTLPSAGGGRRG